MTDTPPTPEQLKKDVDKAVEEILANPGEYMELIGAIKDKAPLSEIIKEGLEALAEGKRDVVAVLPAVRGTKDALRAGSGTSEFKMYSAVGKVLAYVAILAPVIEGIIAGIQAAMGNEPHFGISMVLSGLSVFLKTLLADRYGKARYELKKKALEPDFDIEVVEDAEVVE